MHLLIIAAVCLFCISLTYASCEVDGGRILELKLRYSTLANETANLRSDIARISSQNRNMRTDNEALSARIEKIRTEGVAHNRQTRAMSDLVPIACSIPIDNTYVVNAGFDFNNATLNSYPWMVAGTIQIVSYSVSGGCGTGSLMITPGGFGISKTIYCLGNSPNPGYFSFLAKATGLVWQAQPIVIIVTLGGGSCEITIPQGTYDWTYFSATCIPTSSVVNAVMTKGPGTASAGTIFIDNVRFCRFKDGSCVYDIIVGSFNQWSYQDVPPSTGTAPVPAFYNGLSCVFSTGTGYFSFVKPSGVRNDFTHLLVTAAASIQNDPSTSTTLQIDIGFVIKVTYNLYQKWQDFKIPLSTFGSIGTNITSVNFQASGPMYLTGVGLF